MVKAFKWSVIGGFVFISSEENRIGKVDLVLHVDDAKALSEALQEAVNRINYLKPDCVSAD